jgi:thioredoxin 1
MEITTQELKDKIKNGEKIMVDFWASFCGPCKIMKPMFEKASKTLNEQNSKVQLYTFDISQDREFVVDLGITSVPTIKGFSNGNETFSEIGLKQTNMIIELANKL